MDKIKILFLAANPQGSPLQLDKEAREIMAKIRAAEYRDSFELVTRWAVRPDDLQQALLETKPHVLHFSGHGTPRDEIVLVDEQGNEKPVSKTALQHLLSVLKDNLQVVVLNACYSRPQAEAITQCVDCAVGMKGTIGDAAAILFAGAFYRALGFGRSVHEAFELGRSSLLLDGIPEENTPELRCRVGVDATTVCLIKAANSGDHPSAEKRRGGQPKVTTTLSPEGSFDVFLSHNSQDKPTVRNLADALQDRGLRPWLDERELVPGRPWQEALEEIIQTTQTAAVLFGSAGLGPWEDPEMRPCLAEFVTRRMPVIPVLLPGAPKQPDLPLFLRAFTWVDLRDGLTEKGLDRLEWGITGIKPRGRRREERDQLPPADEPQGAALTAQQINDVTAQVKQQLAAAAQAWLDAECAPFILPSLSRQRQDPERLAQHQRRDMMEARAERQPVEGDDLRRVLLGQVPRRGNRVRIIGDSGMGKTALLHHCEQQIAAEPDGRIPLRIEAISACNWATLREHVLKWMVDSRLHRSLPSGVSATQALAWLTTLVDQAKVVFLLDALDQTEQQWNEAGLRTFLQSAGVVNCPVILTLRPEVAGSAVFSGASWDTLQADGFQEAEQQRRYLGDAADTILPIEDERWRDRASYERKQHWADLLEIPLLLKMLRELARAERSQQPGISLGTLPNRHAIYRQAVTYLVRQGLQSAAAGRFRGRLYDAGEVDDHLIAIGWSTIAQGEGNFSAKLEGRPFRELRKRFRDIEVLQALQQVDVITRQSVLDSYDEAGLAWRHRSFSEYFAGKYLAQAEATKQVEAAGDHARNLRWEWVFRFALSEAADQSTEDAGRLAREIICGGNPFVVYDAIEGDGIQLPKYLDRLCRWLVHRDWPWRGRDYRDAWTEDDSPEVDARWIEILESLFERPNRNSRCLHAAWELVKGRKESWAKDIRQRFLGEFPQILSATGSAPNAVAQSLLDDANFVRCPPDVADDRQPFRMGSPKSDRDAEGPERPQHRVQITPYQLQRFPVTNVQYELFDPSHRSLRDEFSSDDHQPVLWVSWYMAELFCIWLGDGHRLPTEAEWEYAARAGTTTRYWWGDKFDAGKCNAEGNVGRTTPSSADHANPWGLIDMLGNVWEWCQDWYDGDYYQHSPSNDPPGPPEGVFRVIRGGCWYSAGPGTAGRRPVAGGVPGDRGNGLGFRVARSPSGQPSE